MRVGDLLRMWPIVYRKSVLVYIVENVCAVLGRIAKLRKQFELCEAHLAKRLPKFRDVCLNGNVSPIHGITEKLLEY